MKRASRPATPLTAAALRRTLARAHAAVVRAAAGCERRLSVEHVHQARVTARRLRSVLRTLDGLCAPATATRLSNDLRALAADFEQARAADVRREWLGELVDRRASLPAARRRQLERLLAADQQAARAALRIRMASAPWRARLARLQRDIAAARLVTAAGDLAPRVEALLAARWARVRRSLRRAGDDPVKLHAARIRAKRARYACEILLPLLGLDGQPWVRASRRLQTCLGEHHDATDALAWLASLPPPHGAALLADLRRPLRSLQKRRLAQATRLRHSLPKFAPMPLRTDTGSHAARR